MQEIASYNIDCSSNPAILTVQITVHVVRITSWGCLHKVLLHQNRETHCTTSVTDSAVMVKLL